MTISERLKANWKALAGKQKAVIISLALIVVVALVSGWTGAITQYFEIRALERESAAAKKDAEAALKKAAEIASEIKREKEKLAETEKKRDEKQIESDRANENVNRARDDYNRVVKQPRADSPSAEQLCAELAELGYPCQ